MLEQATVKAKVLSMVIRKPSPIYEALCKHCPNCKLVLVHKGLSGITAELQIFVSRIVIST